MSKSPAQVLSYDDAVAALGAAMARMAEDASAGAVEALGLLRQALGPQGVCFNFFVLKREIESAAGTGPGGYRPHPTYRFAYLLIALWAVQPDWERCIRLIRHLIETPVAELVAEANRVRHHADWVAVLDRETGVGQ